MRKKGQMEELVKILPWVIFFAIALGGLYSLLKFLGVF